MRVANKKRGAVIELVLFVMTVIFLLSADFPLSRNREGAPESE